jgi:3-oxoadipate enol-lactonase/4-carboxymuconolactone decarboxylase
MALHRLREIPAAQFLADLAACEGFDSRTRLGEITAPTLVIAAAADRLTPPAESRALHAGISGSRLICVEGVAHMLMLEQPRHIAALIADFLDELAPS